MRRTFVAALLMTAIAAPAYAQLGGLLKKGAEVKKAADDLRFTDDEEQQIGSDISAKLRKRGHAERKECNREHDPFHDVFRPVPSKMATGSVLPLTTTSPSGR